jgi:arylsulfatase
MDLRGRELPNGPYRLSFRLLDGLKDGGEVFYTTDSKTTLPNGKRVEFEILADGKWQPVTLDLSTDSRIYQLRIDVSPGPGKATIAELTLTDQEGKQIAAWPAERSPE